MVLSPVEIGILVVVFLLLTGGAFLKRTGKALGQSVAELRHADDRRDQRLAESTEDR